MTIAFPYAFKLITIFKRNMSKGHEMTIISLRVTVVFKGEKFRSGKATDSQVLFEDCIGASGRKVID